MNTHPHMDVTTRVCREAFISNDIRAIAAGPLFYPLSLSRCQDNEFETERQQDNKISPSSANSDESLSGCVADFLGTSKLGTTGLIWRSFIIYSC